MRELTKPENKKIDEQLDKEERVARVGPASLPEIVSPQKVTLRLQFSNTAFMPMGTIALPHCPDCGDYMDHKPRDAQDGQGRTMKFWYCPSCHGMWGILKGTVIDGGTDAPLTPPPPMEAPKWRPGKVA